MMQFLQEKSDVWNMLTTYYITSPVWLLLTVVAVIYIIVQLDRNGRKKAFLGVLFLVLILLNEVSYHFLSKLFDPASYYRFLWVIPYGMVVAYALVLALQDILGRNRSCKKCGKAVLFFVLITGVLLTTQGNYIKRLWEEFPQNKYLVEDDILEIKAVLDQERVAGILEQDPVMACPKNVMLEYQTIDAASVISTNRVIYLNVREYGADISQMDESMQDKYLLASICEDNAQPEVIAAKTAILREEVDYMIVHANAGMESYMESLGCSLVGGTQSYLIYRYNYPWYEKATNVDKIISMKEIMGINEDEITVDLGLKTTYKILAVNDMHIETMDDTVEPEYRQTVLDRFSSMFVGSTGMYSMDMWNGISSILDSYGADGIICIGDMVDYSGKPNASLLKKGFDKLDTPYTYLRADHDLGVWYTNGNISPQEAVDLSKETAEWNDVFVTDYEEFYLVGWNNSTSQLSLGGVEIMKKIFAKAKEEDKPILLATHVPLNSEVDDSLEKAARSVDPSHRAKLWGEDCLYQPNDTTGEFISMVLAEDSPVAAVFSGHLHFKHTVALNENITEYVLDKSFGGNIGVITVK